MSQSKRYRHIPSFEFPREDWKRLEELADRIGRQEDRKVPRSELVRRAIYAFLRAHEERAE